MYQDYPTETGIRQSTDVIAGTRGNWRIEYVIITTVKMSLTIISLVIICILIVVLSFLYGLDSHLTLKYDIDIRIHTERKNTPGFIPFPLRIPFRNRRGPPAYNPRN